MPSTRITVTLPSEQVDQLRKLTGNVSSFVSEAVAEEIRRKLRTEEFRRYEAEFGTFTDEEMAAAEAQIEHAASFLERTDGSTAVA